MERVIRLTVVTTSMISIGTYALHILVAKETESNYLLMEFIDDTKLGDIMNSKEVEKHTRKPFCRRHWNTLEYSVLFSPTLKKNKAKQN